MGARPCGAASRRGRGRPIQTLPPWRGTHTARRGSGAAGSPSPEVFNGRGATGSWWAGENALAAPLCGHTREGEKDTQLSRRAGSGRRGGAGARRLAARTDRIHCEGAKPPSAPARAAHPGPAPPRATLSLALSAARGRPVGRRHRCRLGSLHAQAPCPLLPSLCHSPAPRRGQPRYPGQPQTRDQAMPCLQSI